MPAAPVEPAGPGLPGRPPTTPGGVRRRAKYRWLWPLTAVNVLALVLAVIGATTGAGLLPYLFPQIWGFSNGLGTALGVITVFVILLIGYVRTLDGIDRKDRLYRFFGGITLASTIMFATYIAAVIGVLMLVGSALN